MSARQTLLELARGERPTHPLLPPCRLEGFGIAFYGEEAVIHAFRAHGSLDTGGAQFIETNGHLAMFAGDTALVADLYGQSIARIWRLGQGAPAEAEPALGVPFDTDLIQARGDLAMRAEDHPALAADAAAHVTSIGRAIARAGNSGEHVPDYRVRPFVLRAFSGPGEGVALFAVFRLGGEAVRTSGFVVQAVHFRFEGERLIDQQHVIDRSGHAAIIHAPWRARVD